MGGFVKDIFSGAVDIVKDTIDLAVDITEHTTKGILNVAQGDFSGAWDEAQEMGHDIVDYTTDITNTQLGVIDSAFETIGISGSVNFLQNMNTGAAWIGHGVIEGNKDALKAGAMIAISLVVTWITWNPYALANAVGSVVALSEVAAIALIAAGYAMTIYTVYGIALSIEQIGRFISNPSLLLAYAQRIKDSMNLAFTTGFINGSMNYWMAGGALYDAPKAGDVMFRPNGHLGTTRFLGLQDKNNSTWSSWSDGKYHDYQRKIFGNLAGDHFFSVSPIAQRM